MNKQYTIAYYCRLSMEDKKSNNCVDASNSIKNQFNLIEHYAKYMPEYKEATILPFYDDGYTGKNFERPKFCYMINLAEEGKINCIIVKDFSRFGRNYIELGRYIEQIFPKLGIRFISINDYYDSDRVGCSTKNIQIFLKNLINDYYSKDLSKKIKSGIDSRKRQGSYIGSTPIFGYRKDYKRKNIEIDKEAADIVEKIFIMASNGFSTTLIARRLNEEGLPTPYVYRKIPLEKEINLKNNKVWNRHNVVKILRDERYTGKYITYHLNHAIKIESTLQIEHQIEDLKSKIIIDNHHEGIVTEQLYQKVQSMLNKYVPKSYVKNLDNILSGKVKCGYCKHGMERTNQESKFQYTCSVSRYSKDACSNKETILEEDITGIIYIIIKKLLNLGEEAKKDLNLNPDFDNNKYNLIDRSVSLDGKIFELYNEYKKNQITKQEFLIRKQELKNVLIRTKPNEYDNTKNRISGIKLDENKSKEKERNYKIYYMNDGEKVEYIKLDRDVINLLINSINIYKNNRIEVKVNFKSLY